MCKITKLFTSFIPVFNWISNEIVRNSIVLSDILEQITYFEILNLHANFQTDEITNLTTMHRNCACHDIEASLISLQHINIPSSDFVLKQMIIKCNNLLHIFSNGSLKNCLTYTYISKHYGHAISKATAMLHTTFYILMYIT